MVGEKKGLAGGRNRVGTPEEKENEDSRERGGAGGWVGIPEGETNITASGKSGGRGGVVKGVIATAKYASAVNGARVS